MRSTVSGVSRLGIAAATIAVAGQQLAAQANSSIANPYSVARVLPICNTFAART
jgi:hypothetical protein